MIEDFNEVIRYNTEEGVVELIRKTIQTRCRVFAATLDSFHHFLFGYRCDEVV